jgi:hypothetical protein
MQIFPRSTNPMSRASLFGVVFVVAFAFWVLAQLQRSPYITYALQPSTSRFRLGDRLPLLSHIG